MQTLDSQHTGPDGCFRGSLGDRAYRVRKGLSNPKLVHAENQNINFTTPSAVGVRVKHTLITQHAAHRLLLA